MRKIISLVLVCFLVGRTSAFAEIELLKNDNYVVNSSPYFRTDVITLNNNLDLDNKHSGDSVTYFGFEYSLDFDLQFKDNGPHMYMKLKRAGPFGNDAPLFAHDSVETLGGEVKRYSQADLLPEIKEFWADFPLYNLPIRARGGLLGLSVGHGFAVGNYYENYGIRFYHDDENFKWNFHYFIPDVVNKNRLGPHLSQEKDEGIDYEHSNAHLFVTDIRFLAGRSTIAPYVGILFDETGEKRYNYFASPTHSDILGTAGLSWDITLDKFSLELEWARNFGRAKSSDPAYPDVEHCGYFAYAGMAYDMERFKPHSRFILASGNKITKDMVDNGDEVFSGSKNRAFSVYSPFNNNLFDTINPYTSMGPLVAMGRGWGLNYGISRPVTFEDPGLFDNIILPGLGFDYQITDKLSVTGDYWYLRAMEKGIGSYEGVSKELSADLGNEVDVSFSYAVNNSLTISLFSGYFFPGRFYKEKRDDTGGSLSTPFIRGDGKADSAYQFELIMEIKF